MSLFFSKACYFKSRNYKYTSEYVFISWMAFFWCFVFETIVNTESVLRKKIISISYVSSVRAQVHGNSKTPHWQFWKLQGVILSAVIIVHISFPIIGEFFREVTLTKSQMRHEQYCLSCFSVS